MRRRLVPVGIFGLTVLVFSLSSVRQIADSKYSMLLSQSLIEYQTFSLDRHELPRYKPSLHEEGYLANGPIYQQEVLRDDLYYYFPPGTSVLSVPFVAAANALGVSAAKRDGSYDVDGEETIQAWLAAILMATVATTFFFTARLALPTTLSIVVALAGAFGTQVYSTASRALWSETWGVLLISAAVFLLLAHERGVFRLRPMVLGTILAWSFFVRPTFAVAVFAIGVYLFALHRRMFLQYAVASAVWFVGFAGYSWINFRQLLPNYYRAGRLDFDDFWAGLAGNVFSPSRGLLVYVPVLLFVGFLLARYGRRLPCPRLVALALAVVAAHLVVVSAHYPWWGGHSFGPRMTTGIVPWFVLLAVLGLAAMLAHRRGSAASTLSRLEVAGATILVCLSVFIHTLGATSEASWRWNSRPYDVESYPERLWDWSQPQLLAAFQSGAACYKPIDAFVADFYRGALRRSPRVTEMSHWNSRLRQAQRQGKEQLVSMALIVGSRVFGSAEYEKLNRSNSEFVSDLYAAYLDREADRGGYNAWQAALANGRGRNDVRADFARSREFQNNARRLCPPPPSAGRVSE